MEKKLEVGHRYLIVEPDRNGDENDLREVYILEYSPSGRYVKLNVPYSISAMWYEADKIQVIEELPVRKRMPPGMSKN